MDIYSSILALKKDVNNINFVDNFYVFLHQKTPRKRCFFGALTFHKISIEIHVGALKS